MKNEIVVVLFGSLCLMFVGCFGKCMMGWCVVFVGVHIDRNFVVVGSMDYAVGFMIVCVTCIGCGFRCSLVSNFVGLEVGCKQWRSQEF